MATPIKGYRLTKDGKIAKSVKHLSVSRKLQIQSSKKVRVVKRGSR